MEKFMPTFKRRKVFAKRDFPVGLVKFTKHIYQKTDEDNDDELKFGEKLMYGEKHAVSCGVQPMKVERIVISEQKANAQSGSEMTEDVKDDKFKSIEHGSTELKDLSKAVDTLKQNDQVDNGNCFHLVSELKTRERGMSVFKRRKVSAIRDFPKGFKRFEEFVVHNSKENCVGKSGDDPVDHKSKVDRVKEADVVFHKHLNADFGSRGDLVVPVVDVLSCGGEFEKQESVMTLDPEAVTQSDVDVESQEAFKDEEFVGQFKCREHDGNGFANMMKVENSPIVKNASEAVYNGQLWSKQCTSMAYYRRFPKRSKVNAVRDFPVGLKNLKEHYEASERNLDHRAADELTRTMEAVCDSQDDVETFQTEIESAESSAPTDILDSATSGDKQELDNYGVNFAAVSTRRTSDITNSNKQIQTKGMGLKCRNKIIVQDSVAARRHPKKPNRRNQSDIESNEDKCKGKDTKRKQIDKSMPKTVVLALMAPLRYL